MTQERWPNHDTYIAHMGTRVCGHLSAHSKVEGTLKRMGDVNDPVTYLSANTFTNWEVQNGTLQKEDSGLRLDIMFSADRNCYFSEKTWGKYDVLSFKGGKATITLKLMDIPVR